MVCWQKNKVEKLNKKWKECNFKWENQGKPHKGRIVRRQI